jgi:hypothetical protein
MKLPDLLIERIRQAVIDLMVNPLSKAEREAVFPQWIYSDIDSTTGGSVSPMDDGAISQKLAILPENLRFALRRFNNLSNVNLRNGKPVGVTSYLQAKNWLDTDVIHGIGVSSILTSQTSEFRQMLIDKFHEFRSKICQYPWIYWMWWPYCRSYSFEHLGAAVVKPDGSFSHSIRFSRCMKYNPDLWFSVRTIENEGEQVLYNPFPVFCHTFWQYSGQPVTIQKSQIDSVTRQDNSLLPPQNPENFHHNSGTRKRNKLFVGISEYFQYLRRVHYFYYLQNFHHHKRSETRSNY